MNKSQAAHLLRVAELEKAMIEKPNRAMRRRMVTMARLGQKEHNRAAALKAARKGASHGD